VFFLAVGESKAAYKVRFLGDFDLRVKILQMIRVSSPSGLRLNVIQVMGSDVLLENAVHEVVMILFLTVFDCWEFLSVQTSDTYIMTLT
jgi:hypothetical protein